MKSFNFCSNHIVSGNVFIYVGTCRPYQADSTKTYTKKWAFETLGIIVAASSVDGCKLLVDYIRDCAGREESTIVVFGGKVLYALAAQANGGMGRAREVDDGFDTLPLRPSTSIILTCLAVADCLKTLVSFIKRLALCT